MLNPFNVDEKLGRNQAEFKLQLAVVEHLKSAFPCLLWTHVPNKGGSAKDGFFKKAMGVRPGVADLIFWWSQHQHFSNTNLIKCGAIELKASKGKQSSDQNKFASSFVHVGGKYAVCKSVREVHEALKSWGLTAKHEHCIEPDTRSKQQKFSDAFDAFKP